VSEQAKAGNVSNRVYTWAHKRMAGVAIQLHHRLQSGLEITSLDLVAFVSGRDQTCPERLAKNKHVSRLRSAFRHDGIRMNHSRDGKAIFRLFISNCMPTCNNRSCPCGGIRAPAQDFAQYARVEVIGPCYQVNGHEGLTAHGVYVAQGVGGSNRPEGIGIIDDRRKEIRSADDSLGVIDAIHGRVIDGVQPNQQFGWSCV
jgi:hypothetical protein